MSGTSSASLVFLCSVSTLTLVATLGCGDDNVEPTDGGVSEDVTGRDADAFVEPPTGWVGGMTLGAPAIRDWELPSTGTRTPGVTQTVQSELPNEEPLACEWDWTIRLLAPFQHFQEGHAPRRMYFASCNTDTDNPVLISSYTIGEKVDAGYNGTSGAITISAFNPETGALEVQGTQHFPECRSMHGVAVSADCSTIAALCRTPVGRTDADHDAISGHPDEDWLTNENHCNNDSPDKVNDHMWLYEWDAGDITQEPNKVIVHKSIGSWEFGQNQLRYGEDDNTYGISLKATVGEPGSCHEADTFLILDRSDYRYVSQRDRGWVWACATGHTIHNRSAYNPTSQKYAMLCSTDWNEENLADMTEVAFHREDLDENVIQHIPRYSALWIKGGAGPIIPRTDAAGFLGIIVGEPPPGGAGYDDATPTQLGLVRFDGEGELQGGVNWLASDDDSYFSWPQLAPLGGDRYLLAWGAGLRVSDELSGPARNVSLRLPWTYWMMEIDAEGNALTGPTEVTDAGWGEVNEMVALGDGRVAWSYVEAPADRRTTSDVSAPNCNQPELVHFVYTSETAP